MPRQLTEQKAKPTREETKAAVELQAPPKRSKPTATSREVNPAPAFRKLSDVGIDGSQKSYLKMVQMFVDDEADVSEPFIMTGARQKPNPFKPGEFQVDFSIQTKGREGLEDYKITLSQSDERMEYVAYFATNTVPLGWLEFHKLPSQDPKRQPYYAIHQVPDDEIPF